MRESRLMSLLGPVLILGFCCGLLPPLHAAVTGENRGDRFMRWRDTLQAADTAVVDGDFTTAETRYLEVIGDAEDPQRANVLLARALDGLADVRRSQERWPEAEALYLRSAEMWERLLGPDQPRLATTLHNLGVVYLRQGKTQDAETALQRALSLWETALGEGSIEAENTRRIYDQARVTD